MNTDRMLSHCCSIRKLSTSYKVDLDSLRSQRGGWFPVLCLTGSTELVVQGRYSFLVDEDPLNDVDRFLTMIAECQNDRESRWPFQEESLEYLLVCDALDRHRAKLSVLTGPNYQTRDEGEGGPGSVVWTSGVICFIQFTRNVADVAQRMAAEIESCLRPEMPGRYFETINRLREKATALQNISP